MAGLPQERRPFVQLARGCEECLRRLQPGTPGQPSAGDDLASLALSRGPLSQLGRGLLSAQRDALAWIQGAIETLLPVLEQADGVLAFAGLATAVVDGGVHASAAIASLGKELVDGQPAELLDRFQSLWAPLYGSFRSFESDATLLPPPEDLEIARAALQALLAERPPAGQRSLSSLLAGWPP